jgi:hypothetical protein
MRPSKGPAAALPTLPPQPRASLASSGRPRSARSLPAQLIAKSGHIPRRLACYRPGPLRGRCVAPLSLQKRRRSRGRHLNPTDA